MINDDLGVTVCVKELLYGVCIFSRFYFHQAWVLFEYGVWSQYGPSVTVVYVLYGASGTRYSCSPP